MQSRRQFISTSAAIAGVTILPFRAFSAGHEADSFADGTIMVYPISHASFVMTTPNGTIYVDPVGDAAAYDGLPAADVILVTHEHGDHFNAETLAALVSADQPTPLYTNPAVYALLPAGMQAQATALANGDSATVNGVVMDTIPAYNTSEGRTNFHPQGRDNGYVLTIDGFRVYISGDTEDIPEMRALTDIDLAFVCMNLPFTMDAEAAASAVAEFKPSYVYPYHYRGRDDGTQDPAHFAALVGDASEVKMGGWYG